MSSLRSDTPDPDDPDSVSGAFVISVLHSLTLTCRVKDIRSATGLSQRFIISFSVSLTHVAIVTPLTSFKHVEESRHIK